LSSISEHRTLGLWFLYPVSLILLGILFWSVCDELSWLILHEGLVGFLFLLLGEDDSKENPDQEDRRHDRKASYFLKEERRAFQESLWTLNSMWCWDCSHGVFCIWQALWVLKLKVLLFFIILLFSSSFSHLNWKKEENGWNTCTIEPLDICEQNDIFQGKRRGECFREKLVLMRWRFWC